MASYTDNDTTPNDPYGYVEYLDHRGSTGASAEQESPYAEPIVSSAPTLSSVGARNISTGSEASEESRFLSSKSGDYNDRNHEHKETTDVFRPTEVLALKKGLKRKCKIDETSCSFWCRNFPDCQVAYQSDTTTTTTTATSSITQLFHDCLCTSTQDFDVYANHETPKTDTVIKALVREYQTKGCQFPIDALTNAPDVRFVDALVWALDPTGCGQVYPEYFFAMAATFGPFEVMLNKLTHTVFYQPDRVKEEETEAEGCTNGSGGGGGGGSGGNIQAPTYFHGFASRSEGEDILREQCGEQLIPGHFVLRFSTRCPGQLSISWINAKKEFKHTKLLNEQKQGFQPIVDKKLKEQQHQQQQQGAFIKIGDLLKHHGNFFKTPCTVRKHTKGIPVQKYKSIKEDVLEKWHEEGRGSDGGAYEEVDNEDVYGEVVVE